MEEIKGLKKKVTEEQQKVLTAHAATKKETKKIKKHISKDAHIASTAEETPFPGQDQSVGGFEHENPMARMKSLPTDGSGSGSGLSAKKKAMKGSKKTPKTKTPSIEEQEGDDVL